MIIMTTHDRLSSPCTPGYERHHFNLLRSPPPG